MSDNLSSFEQKKRIAIAIGAAALGALAVGYLIKKGLGLATPRPGPAAKASAPEEEQKKADTLFDAKFSTQNIQLYSTEAEYRGELVKDVSYGLLLRLSQTRDAGYSGSFRVEFTLAKRSDKPLFLDFQGSQISNVVINGEPATAGVTFEGHRVQLPAQALRVGAANRVTFEFENTYVANSAGLHFYKDPQDEKVYIYSHLEPFFCHRFFPCFDQPSIRASLKLSVLVPCRDWTLVANGVEQGARLTGASAAEVLARNGFEGAEARSSEFLWDFAPSPQISSYIYGLCAGEYHQIDHVGDSPPAVPMRIFCRKSKLNNLNAKEQFRIVNEAIKYYEELFSTPFPYAKYD